MTNLQEARLAREAEICYVTLALVTDYDCWHETEAAVTVEQVIGYLKRNAETAARIILDVVPRLARRQRSCPCASALQYAIITRPEAISEEARVRLAPLITKYI